MSSSKPYYDAEFAVRFMLDNGGSVEAFGSTLTLPIEAKFGTIESVEMYLATVCSFLDLGDPPPVRAKASRKDAHYSMGIIHVAPHVGVSHSWAMREIVVLHELAHHLNPGDSHGASWTGAFIYLVERCIGPEAGFLLMAEMSERGIQITPYGV